MMLSTADTELRYLEGSAAMRDRIHALTGRVPSAGTASFASSCLLHGRLFWESAEAAPLDTRPLFLYYGMTAFFKAMVVALSGKRPNELKQSHGLSCSATNGSKISEFRIKANGWGIFQEFNDVASSLSQVKFFDQNKLTTHRIPTARSSELEGFEISLLDCLSRIPGLQEAYRLATKEAPPVFALRFDNDDYVDELSYRIVTEVDVAITDSEQLRQSLAGIRASAPFLCHWRFRECSPMIGGGTQVVLANRPVVDELKYLLQKESGIDTRFQWDHSVAKQAPPFDPFMHMAPFTSGMHDSLSDIYYIQPVQGLQISEHSLAMAAMLALSSLVRYWPDTWTSFVHRRPMANQPVDDSMMPIVSKFLSVMHDGIPHLVANSIINGTA